MILLVVRAGFWQLRRKQRSPGGRDKGFGKPFIFLKGSDMTGCHRLSLWGQDLSLRLYLCGFTEEACGEKNLGQVRGSGTSQGGAGLSEVAALAQ